MDTIRVIEKSNRETVSFSKLLQICQELQEKGETVRSGEGRIVCEEYRETSFARNVELLSCQLANGLQSNHQSVYPVTEKGNRMEPHWKFLIDNEKSIKTLCAKHSKGRLELADDLYSYCVERLPGIFKTFDKAKGASIRTHVFTNLNWYVWKWVKQKQRPYTDRGQKSIPEGWDVESRVSFDLEISDEVNYILSRLEKYDRLLLLMKHIQGLTFLEIAEVIDATKGTVRNHYLQAIDRARKIAKEIR